MRPSRLPIGAFSDPDDLTRDHQLIQHLRRVFEAGGQHVSFEDRGGDGGTLQRADDLGQGANVVPTGRADSLPCGEEASQSGLFDSFDLFAKHRQAPPFESAQDIGIHPLLAFPVGVE